MQTILIVLILRFIKIHIQFRIMRIIHNNMLDKIIIKINNMDLSRLEIFIILHKKEKCLKFHGIISQLLLITMHREITLRHTE